MKKFVFFLVLVSAMVYGPWTMDCISAEPVKEKGLVAYWSFDEGKGSTAKDQSGNGFNLELADQEWAKGKVGSALKFSGAAIELESSEKLQLGDAISIEVWIYLEDKSGDYTGIVYKWSDYLFRIDNEAEGGKFSFFVNLDGGWEPRAWSVPPDLKKWYHVVGVWNGKKISVYTNGEVVENDRTGTPTAGAEPVKIGEGLIGLIDEVKIYNRALTADEVKAHFKAIK